MLGYRSGALLLRVTTTSFASTRGRILINNTRRYPYHPSTAATMSLSTSSTADAAESFEIAQFLCLEDNYGYLLHDKTTGATAAIDVPFSPTYKRQLQSKGWTLTDILNTHHHHDHTGGNIKLKESAVASGSVKITGPTMEASKIPGMDRGVEHGDTVQVGNLQATVLDVGGHTNGHVAYYFADQKLLFCGDALFALGCGRMFEGTPEQFWMSMERIRELPDDTLVYCGHEYTEANATFALSVEPSNDDLQHQVKKVHGQCSQGLPTIPTLLGDEKQANPFLRIDVSEEIRSKVGVVASDSTSQAFAKLRKAKDRFRG